MTNQPKPKHGGPRIPGPDKRLGRPPKPDKRLRVVKIQATEAEWRLILSQIPGTRKRTEIFLEAIESTATPG